MVRFTRSIELLKGIEDLHYLGKDVIDVAAILFNQLRSAKTTFGVSAIVNLIPQVSSLLSKLNDLMKTNGDLSQEIGDVRHDLISAQNRCTDLSLNFKDISLECCELEQEDELRHLVYRLPSVRRGINASKKLLNSMEIWTLKV